MSFRVIYQRIPDFVDLKAQIVTVEKHVPNVAINEDLAITWLGPK
jgi:hypothetical protein